MFNEEEHPRNNDGKFTDKEGTKKSGYDSRNDLNNIRKTKEDAPSSKGKAKNKDEFFGEEFKGYKGAEAIEKLLKEKRGHIKNAFERPEIGGIDLVWGDENGGILHTITKREKMLAKGTGHISGFDMVNKIPEIIENGDFNINEKDRPQFTYKDYKVVVKPTFDGKKLNWIISAMEDIKKD